MYIEQANILKYEPIRYIVRGTRNAVPPRDGNIMTISDDMRFHREDIKSDCSNVLIALTYRTVHYGFGL